MTKANYEKMAAEIGEKFEDYKAKVENYLWSLEKRIVELDIALKEAQKQPQVVNAAKVVKPK
jgi:exonuclease VII small subunit